MNLVIEIRQETNLVKRDRLVAQFKKLGLIAKTKQLLAARDITENSGTNTIPSVTIDEKSK